MNGQVAKLRRAWFDCTDPFIIEAEPERGQGHDLLTPARGTLSAPASGCAPDPLWELGGSVYRQIMALVRA